MSVEARIELEVWEGTLNRRERLPQPTLPALREALLRLDGDRADSLWIEIEDAGALCVGGGPSRFVMVSFRSDGSSAHVVIGPDDGTTVDLQVGGQTGCYPKVMVLPASLAFEIAERFLEFKEFDPRVAWAVDCPAG
ncbi:MAG: hypothetical protein H7A46_16590 [Verrucomicrobiales bacterium]|nr:hypothetical protein [Verrucomicrobiales bacterium]